MLLCGLNVAVCHVTCEQSVVLPSVLEAYHRIQRDLPKLGLEYAPIQGVHWLRVLLVAGAPD